MTEFIVDADDDDDFVDLMPPIKLGAAMPDCVVSCPALGRQKLRRIQFSFKASVLEEIGYPRYEIAFAAKKRVFRIRCVDQGPFESIQPPKGARLLLRVPVPIAGFVPSDERVAPEFYVDASAKTIRVELENAFGPMLLAAPVRGASTAQSAVDLTVGVAGNLDDATEAAINHRMRELLGSNDPMPPVISGVGFTPSERAILACLLKHGEVKREGLLMATHDPEKADDDRDPKIVDVFISKMRPRLKSIGVEIASVLGGFRLDFDNKTRLRALVKREA